MSIFDVLRDVTELLGRERRLRLADIQQRFELSDSDLRMIVDEISGPRGDAVVDGDELVLRTVAPPVAAEVLQPGETEYRDLAVLFCDLVGSTELSTRLDAEDFSDAIRAYYDEVTSVVDRYGGHVANLMGDGLLVLFGYPQARDDSARQAVAAALAALAAIEERGLQFEIRIGLHVGPVVVSNVGPGGRSGALALGETVNVAARVQSAAEPGGACISDDLARRVHGWFELEPMGSRLFKGLSEPMDIHRVVGSTGARSAIEARSGRGLSPIIGRDEELTAIRDAWASAQAGNGRVVALIGEPGIGKSRLVEEVRREIARGGDWLAGACSPYSIATALHPFADDSELGSLASADPPPGLSAEGQRQWVLSALRDRVVGGSRQRPVVLVVEDLHWADPTTLELLNQVWRDLAGASALMLLTSRESLPATWAGDRVRSFALEPLAGGACADLVAAFAKDRVLPIETVELIVERAGGNPLYLEELTNVLVEAGGQQYAEEIPPALQSPLLARLDGLGDAKAIAQVASVFGAQFTGAALRDVLDDDHRQLLRSALARMVQCGLILADERHDDRYFFRHALIHNAAYQSLLKRRRRDIHGRIVTLWRAAAEASDEPSVEVVARHAAAADLHADAADLFALAGRRAADRSAHQESAQHFVSALESLDAVDGDTTRARLAIQRSHGSTLVALLGYTNPQTVATWQETYELATALDDPREISASLLGLAIARYGSADLAGATALIDDAMRRAQAIGDEAEIIAAHAERTVVAYFGGDFEASLHHGNEGMALYRAADHHRQIVQLVGDDSGVAAASTSAWALMQLGRPEEALARGRAAIALAQSTGHLFSIAQAQLWYAFLKLELGVSDLDEVRALIAFCDTQAFHLWGGAAMVVEAAITGDIELHWLGRKRAEHNGSVVMVPAISGFLSDTLRMAGDLAGALSATEDGKSFADAVGLPFWTSGLLRQRAVLWAAGARNEPASAADVEAVLREALAVADTQASRWTALLAATVLAQLQRDQGRIDEARLVLAPRVAAIVGGHQLEHVVAAATLLGALQPTGGNSGEQLRAAQLEQA